MSDTPTYTLRKISSPSKKEIRVLGEHIRLNQLTGSDLPVVQFKQGKHIRYGHELMLFNPEGLMYAHLRYEPSNPMGNGVRVWLETPARLQLRTNPWNTHQYEPLGAGTFRRIYVNQANLRKNKEAWDNGDLTRWPTIVVQVGENTTALTFAFEVELAAPGLRHAARLDRDLVLTTRDTVELLQTADDEHYQAEESAA